MKPTYKILVFAVPLSGHINPILPLLKEIIEKNKNVKIIVYTAENFRSSIESIGAEYRFVDLTSSIEVLSSVKPFNNKREFQLFNFMSSILLLPEMLENVKIGAKEIDREEPDLIMYDILNPVTKWSAKYYNKYYKLGQSKKQSGMAFHPKKPHPPSIAYTTGLASCDGIYPNDVENFKVGVEFTNPFKLINDTIAGTRMILCPVSPDIQPRSHLFDKKTWKFIGSTLDERVTNMANNSLTKEQKFIDILNKFEIVETKTNILDNENNQYLIFVSLGTVFNNNFIIYKKIIDAFETFDLEISEEESCHRKIKLQNLTVVVSTGPKVYEEFKALIDANRYILPKNIVLVKTAPQIEILKRASLFITHCGMNSTSETIYYGVPVVAIPLVDDQPLNAYRIADELGLGIRLDFTQMNSNDIRKTIHTILHDKSYYLRMDLHSKLSRRHVGHKNGAQLVLEFLQNNC